MNPFAQFSDETNGVFIHFLKSLLKEVEKAKSKKIHKTTSRIKKGVLRLFS